MQWPTSASNPATGIAERAEHYLWGDREDALSKTNIFIVWTMQPILRDLQCDTCSPSLVILGQDWLIEYNRKAVIVDNGLSQAIFTTTISQVMSDDLSFVPRWNGCTIPCAFPLLLSPARRHTSSRSYFIEGRGFHCMPVATQRADRDKLSG